jgi:hypothetical protein
MLYQTQTTFLNSLQSPHNDQFLKYIRPNPNTTALAQLSIYRNSISSRFQKALLDIYPVCEQLVGTEFFKAMANAFTATAQSHSPDLNDYGKEFADFIQTFAPAQSLPYLADTTRLEWGWHLITGAPDHTQFDYNGLANSYKENGERIIFTLPKRVTLLASSYPVHQIWESNQKHYHGDQTITLSVDQQYYFFICRDQADLRIDQVNEREWFILNLLAQARPLAEICEQTELTFPEIDVPTLLSSWVRGGWISGFTV